MLIINSRVPSRINQLVLRLKFIIRLLYTVGVLLAFNGLLGIALLYEIKQSLRWIFQGKPPESS